MTDRGDVDWPVKPYEFSSEDETENVIREMSGDGQTRFLGGADGTRWRSLEAVSPSRFAADYRAAYGQMPSRTLRT